MKKRNTAVISLLVLCALAGGAIWITSNSAAQNNTGASKRGKTQLSSAEGETSNPLITINSRGKAANNGGGEPEIRGLADEIFTRYQFEEAPAGVSDNIKERLVRAEISFRGGKGQRGISDASIVRAVNYLAYKVGAPAYARTDVFELRRMKAAILPYTADLQARSRALQATNGVLVADRKGRATDASTPTMSPLEATFFMTTLVQQKQFNSEYQMTNQEFVALHGGKRQAKSDKMFRGEMHARRDSKRSNELQTTVEKHAAAMTLSEIAILPEELMYVLGIEK